VKSIESSWQEMKDGTKIRWEMGLLRHGGGGGGEPFDWSGGKPTTAPLFRDGRGTSRGAGEGPRLAAIQQVRVDLIHGVTHDLTDSDLRQVWARQVW